MSSPIPPVRGTCVPPHSSIAQSRSARTVGSSVPIDTTRTWRAYFSPNIARTPSIFRACSSGITPTATGSSARIRSFASRSTRDSSSGVTARAWEKSNRRRRGSTTLPACLM